MQGVAACLAALWFCKPWDRAPPQALIHQLGQSARQHRTSGLLQLPADPAQPDLLLLLLLLMAHLLIHLALLLLLLLLRMASQGVAGLEPAAAPAAMPLPLLLQYAGEERLAPHLLLLLLLDLV
jgi:hypothetical protein